MKKIWAPWRLEYILSLSKEKMLPKNKQKPCVFCERAKGKPGVRNLVLFKGKKSYVIMNRYPYTGGHLLVIPYRHIGNYSQITKAEHTEMGVLMDRSIKALNKVYKPQGINLGMNLGEAAGAGIKDHLHYHVIPRWTGDHNFITVVGETRVIMDDLKKSYQKLKKVF